MKFLKGIYHWILAWTGNVRYKNPSRELFVIGVTGTKGKSMVLELLDAILESAGEKTALLTSVRKKVADEAEENTWSNTMPGRWRIQRLLRNAVDAGCTYALVEVTSQGVDQHRHRFVDWDAALFLNLHPEHIEAHGSMERYREAKLNFFRSLAHSQKHPRLFFVNKEDPSAFYFTEAAEKVEDGRLVTYSHDDIYKTAEEIRKNNGPDWLKADFILDNVAAAVAIAKNRGVQPHIIKDAIANFSGLPGRLQFVGKKPFSVVVDYAHTPDSLAAVYRNLRERYGMPDGARLICVLGSAGGGRDKWKRPELGEIVGNYCDVAVFTSEDPYNEDPQTIINDIKKGLDKASEKPGKVIDVLDRREAIEKAIALAREGDMVAITGMGSQKWLYGPKGEKKEWNEPEIAREMFEKYTKSKK